MSTYFAVKYFRNYPNEFYFGLHNNETSMEQAPDLIVSFFDGGYHEEACQILSFLGSSEEYRKHFIETLHCIEASLETEDDDCGTSTTVLVASEVPSTENIPNMVIPDHTDCKNTKKHVLRMDGVWRTRMTLSEMVAFYKGIFAPDTDAIQRQKLDDELDEYMSHDPKFCKCYVKDGRAESGETQKTSAQSEHVEGKEEISTSSEFGCGKEMEKEVAATEPSISEMQFLRRLSEFYTTSSAIETFAKLEKISATADLDGRLVISFPRGTVNIFECGKFISFLPADPNERTWSFSNFEEAEKMYNEWKNGGIEKKEIANDKRKATLEERNLYQSGIFPTPLIVPTKRYYVPIHNAHQNIILGTYETEEQAKDAYMRYLDLSANDEDSKEFYFKALQKGFYAKFAKPLEDAGHLRRIIFLGEPNVEGESYEDLQEQHDWLIELGIGCDIDSYKPGQLVEFQYYDNWVNLEQLWRVCNSILHCQEYEDNVSYISQNFPRRLLSATLASVFSCL